MLIRTHSLDVFRHITKDSPNLNDIISLISPCKNIIDMGINDPNNIYEEAISWEIYSNFNWLLIRMNTHGQLILQSKRK